MYPFRDDNVYVRNSWYVAALREEVTREPIERTIMDDPIVFYRTAGGHPVAMYGICPHRYYPLVRGRVVADALQCGYHGFTFDCRGRCIRIPAQGDRPSGFSQRVYPAVEHGPWLWIWPGDPELADPAMLPDVGVIGYDSGGASLPGWTNFACRSKPVAGRAQLIIDNLLDLTHAVFLHSAIIDMKTLLYGDLTYDELMNGGMLITQHVTGAHWDDFWSFHYGAENKFEGTADYTLPTYYFGPNFIVTSFYETIRIDGFEKVPAAFGNYRYPHAVTPETKHSCHYFFGASRDFREGDAELDSAYVGLTTNTIEEDIAAAEAMEPRIDDAARVQRELLVPSDKAAVRVRKRIQDMIDRETQPA